MHVILKISKDDEFNLLTEYIKQSYIEHPFMFDEVQEINGNRVLRKIRSRFLTREEKNKKRADYEKIMSNKQYYSYKLTSDLSNILQAFTSSNLVLRDHLRYLPCGGDEKGQGGVHERGKLLEVLCPCP
jgi:hypothetical protein